MKQQKTNAMRILEQKKIPYTVHEYPHGDAPVVGVTVAHLTGTDEAAVFKMLVAVGASGQHYVFCVPVAKELDLKKAAKSVGGEVRRAGTRPRNHAPDRLCPRRMQSGRDEKAVPNCV